MVTRALQWLTDHQRGLLWLTVGGLLLSISLPPLLSALRPPPSSMLPGGVLRVGLDPSRPPFAFFRDDGAYAGLEIDIAHALGEALGVDIEFVPLGFDGLYDALRTNQADIIIAGLQPDFSGMRRGVRYSRHYFDAGLVLVSRGDVRTMQDLPGQALAYEFGSPADALAHRWLRRIHPFELRPYQLPEHALQAVHWQQADAALVDGITARLYLRDTPTADLQTFQATHTWYTITLREGRPALLNAINDTLKELHDTGTLDELIIKWL